MFKRESKYLIKLISIFVTATAIAAVDVRTPTSPSPSLDSLLKKELSKQFPNAEIELEAHSMRDLRDLAGNIATVDVLSKTNKGDAFVRVETDQVSREVWIKFSAWIEGLESQRRIMPKETIQARDFSPKRIDVATGYYSEFKNWIVPAKNPEIDKTEAKQTILPKTFLLSTQVEKIPDIRRGDTVKVELISRGLRVSTYGVAQEPGYLTNKIRILTKTSKKELVGKILDSGLVEVML